MSKWTISFDNTIQNIVIQFGMQIIPHLLFYYLTLKLASKLRLSALFALSFLFLFCADGAFFAFALNGRMLPANLLYGLLAGVSGGVYWSTYNNAVFENINGDRRKFLSLNGSGTFVFQLAAPIVMALILAASGSTVEIPLTVYYTFFGISVVLLLAAAVLAFTLRWPKYAIQFKLKGKFFSKTDKVWNNVLAYSYFCGFVSGTGGSLGIIFLMIFSGYSQVIYFIVLSISIAFSALSNYLFKSLKIKNKSLYYFVIALEAAAYIVAAFFYDSTIPIIACAALRVMKAISESLRLPVEMMYHTEYISRYKETEVNISARYFTREIFVIAGRFSSAFILFIAGFFLSENIKILIFVFVSYIFINILVILFYNRTAAKTVPAKLMPEPQKEVEINE